jgi:uncharacterized protein
MVMELKKTAHVDAQSACQFVHYRTQSGQEVDIVLEDAAGRRVGIEVKASKTVTEKEFKSLTVFGEENKDKFIRGIVLYTGDQVLSFGKNFYVVPVQALWECNS